MSIIKDQIEGTDLFRQLSREGYYKTTIQRSKYLPRLEALYLSKSNLAYPTLHNGEEVVCYYRRSLPQLLQNYLYQQGKDSESFFMMEPAIRSSTEAPVETIEAPITCHDQQGICTQDLLICLIDQLIILMEEDLSLKLYHKVVENLTALEDSAEFPNAQISCANIDDLLLFLRASSPYPAVAVIPTPYYLSRHSLKTLDGTYIRPPALEQIPIIPIGTDKEGPSFVLSRHAIEIIYHDNIEIEICFKRLGNYTSPEYVVTARLHYYASINPLLITGVANTEEALKRLAARAYLH
jgi:hypothetical protein